MSNFKKMYEQMIEECKSILLHKKKNQMLVAEKVSKILESSVGGRYGADVLTTSKVAKDLGIHRKCLSDWLLTYKKVYVLLTPTEKLNTSFELLSRVQRRTDLKMTPKQRLAVLKHESERSPQNLRFEKYLKHSGTILYNATNPHLLEFVDTEIILKMISVTQRISNILTKYIKDRESGGTIAKKQMRQKMYEKIVKETV